LRSLIIHEKHCTANPNRVCQLCGRKSIKEIIDKYKELFEVKEVDAKEGGWGGGTIIKAVYKKSFRLRDIVNELDYICPNCILAIIRCLGLNRHYFGSKFNFDYKKAIENWWRITNEEAWEKEEREAYY